MPDTTRLLLGDTTGLVEAVGDPVRVGGPWRPLDGNLTIAVSVAGFYGRVVVEGSVDADASEDSWFPIRLDTVDPEGALLFPLPTDVAKGTTGTFAFTVRARLLWMRARMDRANVVPPPPPGEIDSYGIVRHVLLVR